jgi:hypothetical protein
LFAKVAFREGQGSRSFPEKGPRLYGPGWSSGKGRVLLPTPRFPRPHGPGCVCPDYPEGAKVMTLPEDPTPEV